MRGYYRKAFKIRKVLVIAMTILRLFAIIAAMCAALLCRAVSPAEVRWADEAADTTLITRLLVEGAAAHLSTPNERVAYFGRKLIDTPYVASTLEGTPEQLTVDMQHLDCTTFVETVAALAMTTGEGRSSYLDFLHNLEQLRYRQGRVNGYASRLHYASDWVMDNVHQGLLVDYTDRCGAATTPLVKSIDFMTRNRDKYPALADSAEFAAMKNVESAYRNHRVNFVRSATLSSKNAARFLREGDILLFTTKTPNLDVSHEGIVVMEADGPHLLHASSKAGRVVLDPLPLKDYLKKNPSITGARIIRVALH